MSEADIERSFESKNGKITSLTLGLRENNGRLLVERRVEAR